MFWFREKNTVFGRILLYWRNYIVIRKKKVNWFFKEFFVDFIRSVVCNKGYGLFLWGRCCRKI